MANTELTRVDAWLYSTITGDPGFTAMIPVPYIWNALVPQDKLNDPANAGQRWVTFHNQGNGIDVITANNHRIMVSVVYLVQVFTEAHNYESVEDQAYALDLLLNLKSGSTILSCIRQRPYKVLERASNGKIYAHLGGFYKIEVQ